MKAYYQCAPCFLRQAREALDLATADEVLKMEVMEELVKKIICRDFNSQAVSNEIGTKIHRTIKDKTGNEDPYIREKRKGNEIAFKYLPQIREIIQLNPQLETYAKAAIVGNLIDFGALGVDYDIEQGIIANMNLNIALNHVDKLEKELVYANKVFYLADNNGEIVFDKLFIEKINEYDVEVTVALKEKPILNDACIEDAQQIGLDKVAKLISTGTDSIGVIYHEMSEEFKQIFKNADVVISKGLGNYEGLTAMELGSKSVFCLLNAKCEPIAKDIGVNLGDNVILKLS